MKKLLTYALLALPLLSLSTIEAMRSGDEWPRQWSYAENRAYQTPPWEQEYGDPDWLTKFKEENRAEPMDEDEDEVAPPTMQELRDLKNEIESSLRRVNPLLVTLFRLKALNSIAQLQAEDLNAPRIEGLRTAADYSRQIQGIEAQLNAARVRFADYYRQDLTSYLNTLQNIYETKHITQPHELELAIPQKL